MNGAEALLQTLIGCGVEVCFANPGTSEMQLVAAIDNNPGMRPVLTLFEGVATGAADGYGRMAEKPAATLLHLGPGLANGMANLHNAMRARSPVINIIGDHASYHLNYDAPLTSDLEGHVRLQSDWYRFAESAQALAADGAAAVQASLKGAGKIASLVVPADHSWNLGGEPVSALPKPRRNAVAQGALEEAARALASGEPAALLLGGSALRAENLDIAGRIAAVSGARLLCETFPARIQRGAGRVTPERVPYLGEMAADMLKDLKHIILIGSKAPVSFFAYPDQPSWLSPKGAEIYAFAHPDGDIDTALMALLDSVAPEQSAAEPVRQQASLPPVPTGALTAEGIGACVAEALPEGAIVSDESNTCGLSIYPMTSGAAPHDWLSLTGGAIGQGLPVAVGAAIACPERKVVCLQADGSAMYTLQALWTMVRENLDITTVILNNRSYAILNFELYRLGVEQPGPSAASMLNLTNPELDWVQLAQGMGMPASRATSVEEFRSLYANAMASTGPQLIEAQLGGL